MKGKHLWKVLVLAYFVDNPKYFRSVLAKQYVDWYDENEVFSYYN